MDIANLIENLSNQSSKKAEINEDASSSKSSS
jgi:hypothetical protein